MASVSTSGARSLPARASTIEVRFGCEVKPDSASSAPSTASTPAPTAATPAAALRPYEATYAFIWKGFTAGTSTFTLRRESATQWTYRSETHPRGLFRLVPQASRTLTSRLEVSDDGQVRPLWITDVEDGASEPQSHVQFDWTAMRATGSVEGQAIDMPLKAGVQEDLSAQLSLMLALARGQPPAQFSVFDKSGIRDYRYERAGSETLQTAIGEVATEVYRSSKQYSPRTTRYWCAPSLGFLPVKVEQRRGDAEEWTMELRALRRDP